MPNWMKKQNISPLQIIVHLGGWIPLAHLLYSFFTKNLTANPIQSIEQRTGIYALTFLVLSLACTPASSILGWRKLIQRRKALGNYGFLYAVLHVYTFFVIDYGLDLGAVWLDVWNKAYIILGALAFLMLLPLAITSFKYWMMRLGKNWKRLHRLVYIISPVVVTHFLLASKGDITRLKGDLRLPIFYGVIVAILLILRISPVKKALTGIRARLSHSLRPIFQIRDKSRP
jgi:sulfoxide reductase heme-binding subunit YedZ